MEKAGNPGLLLRSTGMRKPSDFSRDLLQGHYMVNY